MNVTAKAGNRKTIGKKFHETYVIREFDNTDVWAGNIQVECGTEILHGHISRLYLDTTPGAARMRVRVSIELYIRDVTDAGPLDDDDVDVYLWTDADNLGFLDEDGMYQPDPGTDIEMKLLRDFEGNVQRRGNNAVFVSDPIEIARTGAFSCTIRFSADERKPGDPKKKWVYANDIAHNEDRVLVAAPKFNRTCPSFMEICVRKYGARMEKRKFVSGSIKNVTEDLENIPADVLYLLPIFEPGTKDILTGEDVRKGELGSVYAVKDFFRLDPQITTPLEQADIPALAGKGFIKDEDLEELLTGEKREKINSVSALAGMNGAELVEIAGRRAAQEIVARAELRELTQRAHEAGKKIIFDLVIMTTSRDSQLIMDHREWYALDEDGAPKSHKIAWLDYSDVALFDLKYNKPLQNYLGSVAPYWISRCGLDGVRIDASQTVHASFLKQVKNRICMVKPDAIVLGETLCSFDEAVRVPADMIYSLLVDHHVNITDAQPYYNLMEEYHHTFPRGTMAVAYFENHDSIRASAKWMGDFKNLLASDRGTAARWKKYAGPDRAIHPRIMTALKNIQCSLINTLAGSEDGVNLCRFIENGTDFMETERTDFENASLLDFSLRAREPNSLLHKAYMKLHAMRDAMAPSCFGQVYYLRHNLAPDAEDKVLALVRFNSRDRLLFLANLDPSHPRRAQFPLAGIQLDAGTGYELETEFDTWAEMKLEPFKAPEIIQGSDLIEGSASFILNPLQSVVISL